VAAVLRMCDRTDHRTYGTTGCFQLGVGTADGRSARKRDRHSLPAGGGKQTSGVLPSARRHDNTGMVCVACSVLFFSTDVCTYISMGVA